MNLTQLTQMISQEYDGLLSIVVPVVEIKLMPSGQLFTGKKEYPLTREASAQFARNLSAPVKFYLTWDSDLRAVYFNRNFKTVFDKKGFGERLRLTINKERQIIGYDDPKLLKISPMRLIEIVNDTLPKNLSSEQVEVSRLYSANNIVSFSCYSHQSEIEPKVGDIVNAGIDVHHSTSGEFGTQVRVYLRRKICRNGACIHICEDEKHIRARRLSNGDFDMDDMIRQIQKLLLTAWKQIDSKLQAVKGLLGKKRVSPEFLYQERTRFSLNNHILQSIEQAIREDEFGPTGTQYDYFNAISRIATHDESLPLRQQRRLMFMAGEFSQQDIHRCAQCGSWLFQSN